MYDTFDSMARAPRLPRTLPALSIHGTLDDIAPIRFGRELYEALPLQNSNGDTAAAGAPAASAAAAAAAVEAPRAAAEYSA